MEQGGNLKRNDKPTMQQLLYLFELERIGNKRGCIKEISEICGVNHGSVSKYFKTCIKKGYLKKSYEITDEGLFIIKTYRRILLELREYLQEIGIPNNEIDYRTKDMIENVDTHTLLNIIEREKNNKKNSVKQKLLSDLLIKGMRKIGFNFYDIKNKETYSISKVNKGFDKYALLNCGESNSFISLKLNGIISGLQSFKYKYNDVLEETKIKNGQLKIPLDTFKYIIRSSGEIRGDLLVTVNYSTGEGMIIEIYTVLIIWL